MKHQSTLRWLIPPIFVLALLAAGLGLFDPTPGAPFAYTNHRGESVMINGQGLYFYDTVSSAAQMQGNDLITLVVGLPLLVFAALWALRGSLRGRLLLTGTLGFFLYTYMSMSTLTSYNHLFLVYVALFTLSLYAFILCMLSFDLAALPGHFSEKLPRGWIAGLLFIIAAFLALAWLGRILPPLLQDSLSLGERGGVRVAPALENTTTLVIQFMDLALIAPAAALGGILLLRKSAWGYLLASVMLTKGVTMGLGVSAMGINMALRGVPDSLGILVPFLTITAANLVMAIILLKNVKE